MIKFRTFFIRRLGITLFFLSAIGVFLALPRLQELFTTDDTLYLYTFTDIVTSESLEEFKEIYGIKVAMKHFDTNEEMLAKFRLTEGKGYDLVISSEFSIDLLRKQGVLQPLDHKQLPVKSELDGRLLDHYYDPGNKYSLPIGWATYGIMYKKDLFDHEPERLGFELIFEDPKKNEKPGFPYQMSMSNDPREMAVVAAMYLFNDPFDLTAERLEKVEELLIQQKRWVVNYVDLEMRYFFLSGMINIAYTQSQYLRRILDESDDFDFKLPYQGSLMTIDNIAITSMCTQIKEAHLLINFLLSKEVDAANANFFGYNPSNKAAYELVDEKFINNKALFPDEETFKTLHLITNDVPVKAIHTMWTRIFSCP